LKFPQSVRRSRTANLLADFFSPSSIEIRQISRILRTLQIQGSQIRHPAWHYTRHFMSPLIEEALKAIESDNLEVVGRGFLVLAEVVAVNRSQNFCSDVVPEANNEILEWAPLEKIQSIVQRWIEGNPDHSCACSAFWVLDKFRDSALRPFLRHWLERYVQQVQAYLPVLGQILTDLDSIGEARISNHTAAINHGKSVDDAIRYLEATKSKK
jgi:hypothetical protein